MRAPDRLVVEVQRLTAEVTAHQHDPISPEMYNAELIKEFAAWREEVDQDLLLDTFDLALGYFSGKGIEHDRACDLASWLMDHCLSGIDEMKDEDFELVIIH